MKQFKSIDKNQDGTISKEELFDCYRELDPLIEQDYLEDIFKQIDINCSGKIDFSGKGFMR